MKRLTAIFCVLLLFCSLIGCGTGGAAGVEGSYLSADGDILELTDGSYTLTYSNSLDGLLEQGTYTVDGDSISFVWNGIGEVADYDAATGTITFVGTEYVKQ